MANLILVFPDQLSMSLSSLQQGEKQHDRVMLCELKGQLTYVKHHQKKIAFLLAAMRHFAEELRDAGFSVRYVSYDDPNNTQTLEGELKRALQETQANSIITTEPSEWYLLDTLNRWNEKQTIKITLLPDQRFLASHETFRQWATGKKQLRMEYFYREMRKKYTILLEADGSPMGGKWNYDEQNRQPPVKGMTSPRRISHKKSPILIEVLTFVGNTFQDHFGHLEPFHYAVTRTQALLELKHFIKKLLPHFGTYQDAMVRGEAYLYHSLLSSYLNAGLLLPLEICKMAEKAYHEKVAPLHSVEGFIRQILGWREYIRGIYWWYMPEYQHRNYLDAQRPLPEFYWNADTKMSCVREAVEHTRDHAYSHHIQRLMVTGNFALIAGLDVKAVQAWYLAVYSDAYEWVEMPNTLGMSLFGDGGVVASKPYAASGKYIQRMSNFCKDCVYNPAITTGETACPFNAFYWDFIQRHKKFFQHNQRMRYMVSTWEKFPAEKKEAILQQSSEYFKKLEQGDL
jgi:deoxyribodipyrimidine photolyase-related protein